jgi:hypothetical protein
MNKTILSEDAKQLIRDALGDELELWNGREAVREHLEKLNDKKFTDGEVAHMHGVMNAEIFGNNHLRSHVFNVLGL